MLSYLQGGDLRSIANVEELLRLIRTQNDFDTLFQFLLSEERLIKMRAADAIEKVTAVKPAFLQKHKVDVLRLLNTASHKELKWHMALLASRLEVSSAESKQIWDKLTEWTSDKAESKIVRVNSLQALSDMAQRRKAFCPALVSTMRQLEAEHVPSLNARIRKLKKSFGG